MPCIVEALFWEWYEFKKLRNEGHFNSLRGGAEQRNCPEAADG